MRPCQVISLLQAIVGEEDQMRDRRQQSLFGHKVCQQAFRALLGLGSERWRRLKKCAQMGQKAPVDGRSLPRANLHANRKNPRIDSWLWNSFRKFMNP